MFGPEFAQRDDLPELNEAWLTVSICSATPLSRLQQRGALGKGDPKSHIHPRMVHLCRLVMLSLDG
jgi:hypothetical protein